MTSVRRGLVAVGVWLAAVTSVGALVWATLSTVEQRSSLAVRVDGDLPDPVSTTVTTPAPGPSSAGLGPTSASAPVPSPAPPSPSASAQASDPARGTVRGGDPAAGGRGGAPAASPSGVPSGPRRGGRAATAAPAVPAPSSVTYRGRGGRLVLTCSGTAIANLRGTTGVGWNGRWAVVTPGVVVVWFTRGSDVEELRLSCSDGAGEVAEVRPGDGLLPARRGGDRRWNRPPHW